MNSHDNKNITRPLVSVIIATYKREEILCQALLSLFDQDYPEYEIIVVDQTPAHTPQTERFFKAHQARMRYLKLDKPSLPNARNVGVHHARGDIVLFTDDDAIPVRHFISAHVAAYDSDNVASVGGQVIQPDGITVSTTDVGQLNRFTRTNWNFNSTVPTDIMYATGGNMSFRRDLLIRAGLFEPAFAGNAFYEETDLCLRIIRAGYRIKFEPGASIRHFPVTDGGCGNNRQSPRWYYWYLHNSLLLSFRHRSMFSPPAVLWEHIRTIAQDLKDPPLLAIVLPATIHAFLSYVRSKASLKSVGQTGAVVREFQPLIRH